MIRKYRESDCEALIEVWFAASQVATPFLSDEFLAEERDKIRKIYLSKAETWVFEIEDTVAGFIALIGNEVGALFVHSKLQGRGIGRALMDHAAGLRDSLYLDVFKENAVGCRFYDRYGFRFEREHVHEQSGHSQIRLVYTPNDNVP
jgi:putative acetyltransferase